MAGNTESKKKNENLGNAAETAKPVILGRSKRLAVVRVRGAVKVRSDIADTLEMLHLKRVNFCAVLDDRPAYRGMINKVKDYVTWGEIDEPIFAALVSKWARKAGDAKLEISDLQEKGFPSFEDFAKKFFNFEVELEDIGAKPVFRLHPPTKGYERGGIKHPFTSGGVLGYRGAKINDLIARMAGLRDLRRHEDKAR